MPYESSGQFSILLICIFILLTICILLLLFKFRKTKEQQLNLSHNDEINKVKIKELEAKIIETNNEKKELLDKYQETTREIAANAADLKNWEEKVLELKTENNRIQQERNDLYTEFNSISKENSRLKTEILHLNEINQREKKLFEKTQLRNQEEFKKIAAEVLSNNSQKFSQQSQANLTQLISPLKEKLQSFESKVEQTHKESIHQNASLRQQILDLKDLNQQMAKDAKNLTKALLNESKTQGDWGEMILESILQKSGLERNREYEVQSSYHLENKRLIPDVVVHLPKNQKLIIDSKVSLKAYHAYVNATNEESRTDYLKAHVISIQRHIKNLSEKKYEELFGKDSPNFVLLFIPIESAFALASMAKPNLYSDAFEKNIILVSPTTLLAVLRTIDSIWQTEKQKKNTIAIAQEAGKLHDTFVNLLEELDNVGLHMQRSVNSYDSAMKKLKGNQNLFKKINKLKKLGAVTKKQLPYSQEE